MNGDVVFDKSIFEILDKYIAKNISFVAVNTSKVAEEEVNTLKNGYIDRIIENCPKWIRRSSWH